MKNIVSPGFAKSGTTLLHALLSRSSHLAAPRNGKEPNLFLSGCSDYNSHFEIGDETIATFEFSPAYFNILNREGRRELLRRIKTGLEDPLIVVALRSPYRRAISAYLHVLQDFSRFGAGRYTPHFSDVSAVYSDNFEEALSDPVVGMDMAGILVELMEEFTPDQVLFFFLETDARNMARFAGRLSAKLGVKLNLRNLTGLGIANPGGGIPTIHYSMPGHDTIIAGGEEFRLPHRSLYVATGRGHTLSRGVKAKVGRAWMEASRQWTSTFDADLWRRAWGWGFAEMTQQIDSIVAGTEDAPGAPKYSEMTDIELTIEYVPPSAEFLRLNQSTGVRISFARS